MNHSRPPPEEVYTCYPLPDDEDEMYTSDYPWGGNTSRYDEWADNLLTK